MMLLNLNFFFLFFFFYFFFVPLLCFQLPCKVLLFLNITLSVCGCVNVCFLSNIDKENDSIILSYVQQQTTKIEEVKEIY